MKYMAYLVLAAKLRLSLLFRDVKTMKLRWWLSAVVYTPFLILAMLLAPVLPIFEVMRHGQIDNGNGYAREPRLVWWLDWFMTQDNSLLGDANWKATHDGSYWSQVLWLWRNPAYGLAWGPLSYSPEAGATYTRTELKNGYRIDGPAGVWEETTYGRLFKVRTGWILGNANPGKAALFLLSIRLVKIFNR